MNTLNWLFTAVNWSNKCPNEKKNENKEEEGWNGSTQLWTITYFRLSIFFFQSWITNNNITYSKIELNTKIMRIERKRHYTQSPVNKNNTHHIYNREGDFNTTYPPSRNECERKKEMAKQERMVLRMEWSKNHDQMYTCTYVHYVFVFVDWRLKGHIRYAHVTFSAMYNYNNNNYYIHTYTTTSNRVEWSGKENRPNGRMNEYRMSTNNTNDTTIITRKSIWMKNKNNISELS